MSPSLAVAGETGSMNTFGEQFYLEEATLWQRLTRNVRLMGYILKIVWLWTVVGARVRRAHRKAQQSDEIMTIDFLAEELT